MSSYHPLTELEAIELAKAHVEAKWSDQITCGEIGDGNLNLVFHIQDTANGHSIIMKQALPYAKVVGESWPLSLDRARIESEALQIEGKLCPGLVPKVYKYIPELALTIMEDLSDHTIMRKGLIEGNQYPLFAGHIAEFMAKSLFFTSDLGMNQQEKKVQAGRFINPDLCKITEDLIFDDPYTDSPNNDVNPAIEDAAEALRKDEELHFEVALLREKFLTKGQALIHGDLHTGSVFVTKDSTKVIDPEFAFYGPMGYDTGAVLANLILNYCGQIGWRDDESKLKEFHEYLISSIREIWEQFEQHFRTLWNNHLVDRIAGTNGYQDHYINELLQDTFGYAGCKVVRRIVGLSHVADIHDIKDPKKKELAQRQALSIGTALIKHHRKAKHINEMIEIIKYSETR